MTPGRLLLLLAVLVAAFAQARASPLDADTCTKLKSEHSQLELAGIEADLAKGPEWAKVNLASEKIEQIRRFIELEEQLLFRCRGKSLVNLPSESDPAGDGKDDDKAAAAPKAASPPPGAAKKAKAPAAATKKKTEPAKKAAVQPPIKPAALQTKQAPGAAKTKPPAKAAVKPADVKPAPAAAKRSPQTKSDDANKAPPPASAANPGQLAPAAK